MEEICSQKTGSCLSVSDFRKLLWIKIFFPKKIKHIKLNNSKVIEVCIGLKTYASISMKSDSE